jgi:phage terminase large subunit GpA-like protein
MLTKKGPGYCHFPKRYPYDEAYFEQATVEKAITKYKHGRPYKVWECKDGARNEAWDNIVYNYAAYFATGVDVARRLAEMQASTEPRSRRPRAHQTEGAGPAQPRRPKHSGCRLDTHSEHTHVLIHDQAIRNVEGRA